MAQIASITTKRVDLDYDAESLVTFLDTAIYNVGVSVTMIRDMTLHGSPGTGSTECNPEEVTAVATSLLAYLSQVGLLIDRLETEVRADRLARQR